MVNRCFEIMDRNSSGQIAFDELKAFLSAKDHPDVISGLKTEIEIVDEFLGHFQGSASNNNGSISKMEFVD